METEKGPLGRDAMGRAVAKVFGRGMAQGKIPCSSLAADNDPLGVVDGYPCDKRG